MKFSEFEQGFKLLQGAYGERQFPSPRGELLWRRWENSREGTFLAAVQRVVEKLLPPAQVLEFIDDRVRAAGTKPKTAIYDAPETHACDACRDFGFGFDGDTVVACICSSGRKLNPADLARHQASYDQGRKMFPTPQSMLKAFGGEL